MRGVLDAHPDIRVETTIDEGITDIIGLSHAAHLSFGIAIELESAIAKL
ncbi:hypothetical protein [Leptolyngbya sp. NIES-2104]|nr:hypothetical protein [Leptolyngbya sp. NIES-2104]GAP96827.1 hypothetical protein NIES2104_33740 [Leptolyngbya sp. NIES-2104]